jgi:hypothetical protein
VSGRKMKQLRKQIYGDHSQREEHKYGWELVTHGGQQYSGGIVATGLRRVYQDAKHDLKENRRNGKY